MAKMINKSGGGGSFGLEEYDVPKQGLATKAKQVAINKNKTPGPIEREAKYRAQFPGAGQYKLMSAQTWDVQNEAKNKRADFSKSPRITEADELEIREKKGKGTPSPFAYKPAKEKFLPSIGKGHMGL